MTRLRRTVAVACTALLLLGGCSQRSSGPMPAEAGDSIDAVTSAIQHVGAVLGSFSSLPEALAKLATNPLGVFGECPKISSRLTLTGGAAVGFDYGTGCPGLPLAGKVLLGLDFGRLEGTVGFERFRALDREVQGDLAIKPVDKRFGQMRVRFNQLRVQDLGWVTGETALSLSPDGTIAMSDGQLKLRDVANFNGGVDVSDLAFNLLRNGNALPQAGQVKFVAPLKMMGMNAVDATVRFDANTPKNGHVKVWVGPMGPYDYELRKQKPGQP